MPEAHEVEAPHLLKVVEAASASSQNDPQKQEDRKTKRSKLGSLRLNWLEQVTNDTGVTDAAFRFGHKIAEHINEDEMCAWPRMSTIASLLGRSERSVRDGVHTLVHRRHLACSKRGSGNLNQYVLLLNGLTVEERDHAETAALAASKAPSGKRKREASTPPIQSQEPANTFDRFMATFPLRGEPHDYEMARASYERNLSKGVPASVMQAGAEVYKAVCDETKATGGNWVWEAYGWLDYRGWREADPDDISYDDEGL